MAWYWWLLKPWQRRHSEMNLSVTLSSINIHKQCFRHECLNTNLFHVSFLPQGSMSHLYLPDHLNGTVNKSDTKCWNNSMEQATSLDGRTFRVEIFLRGTLWARQHVHREMGRQCFGSGTFIGCCLSSSSSFVYCSVLHHLQCLVSPNLSDREGGEGQWVGGRSGQ